MRKTLLTMAVPLLMLWGCGDGAKQRSEEAPMDESSIQEQAETHGTKVETVELTTPLDPAMVKEGESIYDLKCSSCHRLSDERLVGPGWKGVSERREPTWILNMITNVDMMLAEDAEAQKLLELCLVRMPNQNISQPEARSLLEFMRKNDGVQ